MAMVSGREWQKVLTETTSKLQEAIAGKNGGKSFEGIIAERGGEDAVMVLKA